NRGGKSVLGFLQICNVPNNSDHMIGVKVCAAPLPRGLLTCVDHRNATTFAETCFPICAVTAMCQVRNNESGGQEGRSNLDVNQAGGLLISEDAKLETSTFDSWPEALIHSSIELRLAELHCHECCTAFDPLLL